MAKKKKSVVRAGRTNGSRVRDSKVRDYKEWEDEERAYLREVRKKTNLKKKVKKKVSATRKSKTAEEEDNDFGRDEIRTAARRKNSGEEGARPRKPIKKRKRIEEPEEEVAKKQALKKRKTQRRSPETQAMKRRVKRHVDRDDEPATGEGASSRRRRVVKKSAPKSNKAPVPDRTTRAESSVTKKRSPAKKTPRTEGVKSTRSAKPTRKRDTRGQKGSGVKKKTRSDQTRPHIAADGKELTKRKYAPGEGKSGRRILISTREDQESRVCVVAEQRLEELYVDKVGDNTYLGNIYLGKVVNLEPSIGAAFVDFGEGKNGFLHASDVIPTVQDDRIKDFLALSEESKSRTHVKRSEERKNIDELLSLGEELVVQITKDGIGHKGPTLTTYISIPGCYLVLMPNLRRTGVSRKISDNEERRRLREILIGMGLPEGLGFIIRTAGEDHPRQDLERDAQFLMKMWKLISRRLKGAKAPANLYRETDLILRSLRDLFTQDTVEVVVDSEIPYKRCLDFMQNVMPQYSRLVKLHEKPKPLFTEYGIDSEVEKVFKRKIQLSSGGSIVFDQTEALVAIDVNSGKNKEEPDLEETALKTNLDAIPEIVRQLRLRDLGGLVIIDFIDMMEDRHRRRLERALRDELRKDRARFRMEGISMFGIIELTRQRVRPSLFVAATVPCPSCGGIGTVKGADSVSHLILRRIRGEMAREDCEEVEVRLNPEMAAYFQNTRRQALNEMEETFEKVIRITPDVFLRYEDLRLAFHSRARDLSSELEHHMATSGDEFSF